MACIPWNSMQVKNASYVECVSQLRNNSYEWSHSSVHNFQIMLLLLSIMRHLWVGEPKWKYGLGTRNGSSCQMEGLVVFSSSFLFFLSVEQTMSSCHIDALTFLCKKQASCCSSENCRKNTLKEHKPSSLSHSHREYIQSCWVKK